MQQIITPPCKDCKERQIGCHSYCRKYIEFRMNWDEIKLKERKEKMIQNAVEQSIVDGMRRSRKKRI